MKDYECYIYTFETSNENLIQRGVADNFENPLANLFNWILGERRTFEFDEINVAIFEKLFIDKDCFLGLYGCAPAKNNTYVNNRNYETFDVTQKNEASTVETIFFADFNKKSILAIDIKGIIGFSKNLERLLSSRKVKLSSARFQGWQKYLKNKINEIKSITIKERDNSYEPKFSKLNSPKYAYIYSKFRIDMTIDEFVQEIESIKVDETFEVFTIEGVKDGHNQIIDAIENEIKAKKRLQIDENLFANVSQNLKSFLEIMQKVNLGLIFNGKILLE